MGCLIVVLRTKNFCKLTLFCNFRHLLLKILRDKICWSYYINFVLFKGKLQRFFVLLHSYICCVFWLVNPCLHMQVLSTLSTPSLISPSFQGGPTIFHKGNFLKHTPLSKKIIASPRLHLVLSNIHNRQAKPNRVKN